MFSLFCSTLNFQLINNCIKSRRLGQDINANAAVIKYGICCSIYCRVIATSAPPQLPVVQSGGTIAFRHTFKTAKRRLGNYTRTIPGDIKTHEAKRSKDVILLSMSFNSPSKYRHLIK